MLLNRLTRAFASAGLIGPLDRSDNPANFRPQYTSLSENMSTGL